MKDFLLEFDWEEWADSYDKICSTHPLLSPTKKVVPFKEFLQDYVWAQPDIITLPGFENTIIELPILVFTNRDGYRRKVINILELNAFELIKYGDCLFIEEKEAGTYMLRGDLPEEFEGDRGTRKKWKTLTRATENRRAEKRTTGWIPDAEVGR